MQVVAHPVNVSGRKVQRSSAGVCCWHNALHCAAAQPADSVTI